MSTWRTSLVCIGLVTIAVLLSLGSTNNAYAVDYSPFDNASCLALPGGGTSWNGITSTCTKSSGGHITINAGDTLTIPNGITLVITSNAQLRTDPPPGSGGVITNNGVIVISGNSLIRIHPDGVMINNGDIITTNRDIVNEGDFTNNGLIDLSSGGDLSNRESATFTNSGTIEMNSILSGTAILQNIDSASFTNTISGIITISGSNSPQGQLHNQDDASFTNSGTITITGTDGQSGQLRNQHDSSFTNYGTVTITGVNDNSGQLRNNNNGLIVNNCGTITFVSISGNPIQEEECEILPTSGTSTAYEDPTIGKTRNGKQVVENGICIDINCWTVSADFHQDFELVELLSDSIHTITTTVFCQNGVNKCNYVAFGVSPYGTNINDSVWKIILQKDHRDHWTMKVNDPNGYLGEVTTTTQIVNDNRYLAASATIEFKKPTPGMILNIEVRDSGGGYRDFKFNDGVEIIDAYAYPFVETSYEPNLEIKPLCLNENPNKRYTCAFDKVRDWTIKNAEDALKQIK